MAAEIHRTAIWRMVGLIGGLLAVVNPCAAQTNTISEWHKQLVVRLNSYKRFPLNARGASGTAVVGFILDRSGRPVSSWLDESAGVPELDQEAIALVERAQPFPAPPAELADDELKLRVPLNFKPGAAARSQFPTIETRQEDAAINSQMRRICRGC